MYRNVSFIVPYLCAFIAGVLGPDDKGPGFLVTDRLANKVFLPLLPQTYSGSPAGDAPKFLLTMWSYIERPFFAFLISAHVLAAKSELQGTFSRNQISSVPTRESNNEQVQ